MNRYLFQSLVSGLSAVAILMAANSATAQVNVALVDVAQVFESHPQFKNRLQNLKHEADSLQNQVMQQRQNLIQEAESASLMLTPGSDEFRQKEKDLAMRMAQLDVDSKSAMRDLMAREARLHYDVYREINQIIETHCQENGIRVILRFNRLDSTNAQDPESVIQHINSTVVYYRPDRDVTSAIIQRLTGRAANGNGGISPQPVNR